MRLLVSGTTTQIIPKMCPHINLSWYATASCCSVPGGPPQRSGKAFNELTVLTVRISVAYFSNHTLSKIFQRESALRHFDILSSLQVQLPSSGDVTSVWMRPTLLFASHNLITNLQLSQTPIGSNSHRERVHWRGLL